MTCELSHEDAPVSSTSPPRVSVVIASHPLDALCVDCPCHLCSRGTIGEYHLELVGVHAIPSTGTIWNWLVFTRYHQRVPSGTDAPIDGSVSCERRRRALPIRRILCGPSHNNMPLVADCLEHTIPLVFKRLGPIWNLRTICGYHLQLMHRSISRSHHRTFNSPQS